MVRFPIALPSVPLLLCSMVLLALGQPTHSFLVGFSCNNTEGCERVVDAECRDFSCACNQGYIERSRAFCQYSGDPLFSPWDTLKLNCESQEECEVAGIESPCKRTYYRAARTKWGSLIQTVKTPVILDDLDQDLTITLRSQNGSGEVNANVNYHTIAFEAGTRMIIVGHVKIQKDVTVESELETDECTYKNVSCARYVPPCTGNCAQRKGITEFLYGLRPDCLPEELPPTTEPTETGGCRQLSCTGLTLLPTATLLGALFLKNSLL